MKDLTGAAQRLPEPVTRLEVGLDGAEATQAWAARLAGVLRAGDVLILTGELGAGKTTFTQGLGAGLGVREGIISPTFVLSRIHPSVVEGPDLVHVDAYRLGSAGELSDLDLDATVDRSVTVVEWGRGLAEPLAGWPDDPDASWLDIELLRATGSGEPGDAGVRADPEAGTIITDFSDEDGTGADEPRTAVVLGYGPRWATVDISGLTPVRALDQPVSPQMAAGVAASSRARRAIGDEFGWLTASEASRLLGSTQSGGAYANDQRKNNKALGVPVRNTFAYPGFQFTESGQVHPTVLAVLRSADALEVDADTVAQWFCLPSAGLDDVRPVDILIEDEAVLADFNGRFGAQW